jgi:rhodanese-related sulfurtransferase
MAAALLSSRAVVSMSVRARLVRARVASRHRARATAAYAGRAKRITVHDANDLLASDASVVYLDVRSEGEYKDQHRVGSVNIPVADMQGGAPVPNPKFVESVNAAYPGKTQRFVVGCAARARSLFSSLRRAAAAVAVGAATSRSSTSSNLLESTTPY